MPPLVKVDPWQKRLAALDALLGLVQPVPTEWLEEGRQLAAERKHGIQPLPCDSWPTLCLAWKKALSWRRELEEVLAVMLAVVVSTEQTGDQLFLMVIGEPGCLHPDTPIFDPTDGSSVSVKERHRRGVPFHVWSKEANGGLKVREAQPPCVFPHASMFKVTFRSGREITTTARHKLWDGQNYVTVAEIVESAFELAQESRTCCLPSIPDPSTSRHWDVDDVVKVEPAGVEHYYDFEVPETNNYWACGVIHHNSAKSRLCDALLVSKGCLCVEHITGFHSGYTDASGEDFSFLARADRRTWVTSEGDVMMANPKFTEIMSQMRRIFDGSSKATYKNKKEDQEHKGLRTPWIMAGTPALLNSDQSRLGDRFLKILIRPPDEAEKQRILKKVGHAAWDAAAVHANGQGTVLSPDLTKAYALTGGYVDHLRRHCSRLLDLDMDFDAVERVVERCGRLAELTAALRARPDPPRKDGQEKETLSTKELPSRLTHQFVRLARCLAAVQGKTAVDEDVLRLVGKVALDTAAGRSLNVVNVLFPVARDQGVSAERLGHLVGEGVVKIGTFLRFLQRIKVVELFYREAKPTLRSSVRWRLTREFHDLYAELKEGG